MTIGKKILVSNVHAHRNQIEEEIVSKVPPRKFASVAEFMFDDRYGTQIPLEVVPDEYQALVKTIAGGRSSFTRAELYSGLDEAVDRIVKEDKTFGIFTRHGSPLQRMGIGGDGVLQPAEQARAAAKSPLALRLLEVINAKTAKV